MNVLVAAAALAAVLVASSEARSADTSASTPAAPVAWARAGTDAGTLPVTTMGAGVAILLLGIALWNRVLRRQVATRTRALAQSEARYRQLVDDSSDMIYCTDAYGRFTFVNPRAMSILGYAESELLSTLCLDLVPFDRLPGTERLLEDALRRAEPSYIEFPVKDKQGREIWLGQHVQRIVVDGEVRGLQGIASDVTDRVRAQIELQTERDFVSAVLDTAASLVLVTDRYGRVVRFNRACEQLAGHRSGDVINRPLWSLPFVQEDDRNAFNQRIARVAESVAPVLMERRWTDVSGRERLIAWTVTAIRDQAGQPTHYIGVGTDVTEARELEKLKSTFVSMVSHELRTPLTSIKAAMQLLRDLSDEDGVDSAELLNVSLSNADRLIRIVNDILDLSKIEAGQLQVRTQPCAVASVVEESVRTVEQFARVSSVKVSGVVPADVPAVNADPDRSVQVLVNLLSNAIKHAPEGSTVHVEVAAADDHVAISVRDEGAGIPPEKLDFIFQPFTQLDGGDTRRIAGTGLGLTITKALVELQGGAVTVESQPGAGATFTVTLPKAQAEAASPAA